MELTTAGALMKFAMRLENQALEFYEETAGGTSSQDGKQAFSDLAGANRKSAALLERLYKDNTFSDMDVGVNEPVAGLDPGSYSTEVNLGSTSHYTELLELALELEKKAGKFYLDCIGQINSQSRSVLKRLDKLAKEKAERQSRLNSLLAVAASSG